MRKYAGGTLAVVNLINAINDPVVYTNECHQEILDAREAYNNLTQAQKVMIDGVMYIIRGEHMYDAQGQVIK